jgi:hypothetical protein
VYTSGALFIAAGLAVIVLPFETRGKALSQVEETHCQPVPNGAGQAQTVVAGWADWKGVVAPRTVWSEELIPGKRENDEAGTDRLWRAG